MAADEASNGTASAIDRAELRQGLVTSSTKRRIAELAELQHHVEDDSESGQPADLLPVVANHGRQPSCPPTSDTSSTSSSRRIRSTLTESRELP